MNTAPPVHLQLTGAALACGTCGVALDEGAVVVDREVIKQRFVRRGEGEGAWNELVTETAEFGRCRDCAAIDARVDALLDAYPRLAATIGARSIARHRLGSALAACELLGVPVRIDRETDLATLLEHVTAAGAGLAWSLTAAGRAGGANVEPWWHVTAAQRQAARDGIGAYLRARNDRPVRVTPPRDVDRRGCLLCGVGAVRAMRSRADDAWGVLEVAPRLLGGRGGELLLGVVCPGCEAAIQHVGTIGPAALETALLRSIGWTPRGLARPELRVVGWGALPDGTPPNARPWAHLDVETLRAELKASGL